MPDQFLIVGLGNPGSRYEKTRHNIGFRAVDLLAQKHGIPVTKLEQRALVGSGTLGGTRVLLAKPQTFMNVSGDSVGPLVSFYKIPHERILILCDDLDIPFGTLRLRKSGSAGGQNGMKHILQRLGTQEINRVRMGIGRPPGRMDPADYVLSPFKGDEEITAIEMTDRAVKAVETWLADGIEAAMNRYNGTGEAKPKPATPQPESE
ncbi:MAG: aminoacyl-tRNA hydrolase [Chloroflexota bacterium]|nr:aminoacyl-tRNA hydrolase [Chloroflexota bacterium]